MHAMLLMIRAKAFRRDMTYFRHAPRTAIYFQHTRDIIDDIAERLLEPRQITCAEAAEAANIDHAQHDEHCCAGFRAKPLTLTARSFSPCRQ